MENPRHGWSSRYNRGRSGDAAAKAPRVVSQGPNPALEGISEDNGPHRSSSPLPSSSPVLNKGLEDDTRSYNLPHRPAIGHRREDNPEPSASLKPNQHDAVRPHRPQRSGLEYSADTLDSKLTAGSKPPSGLAKSAPTLSFAVDGKYQYKDLEDSCIRLIKVLPDNNKTAALRCEMLHVSLDSPPPFTAISYTWGDARDTTKIELDGGKTSITVSLHGALCAVRLVSTPILAWADAICINQGNMPERTQQVALMTKIYSEASKVALWLGPEEEHASPAFSLLQAVANLANLNGPDESEGFERLVVSEAAKYPGTNRFTSVVDLFERDYWYVSQKSITLLGTRILILALKQGPLVGCPRAHQCPLHRCLLRRCQNVLGNP